MRLYMCARWVQATELLLCALTKSETGFFITSLRLDQLDDHQRPSVEVTDPSLISGGIFLFSKKEITAFTLCFSHATPGQHQYTNRA